MSNTKENLLDNILKETQGVSTIGMGGGDALSRKLRRSWPTVGLGSPRRALADDEFAGTYLSRVTSKNEPPVKHLSFFPDQFEDDEEEDEFDEIPLRTRKINLSTRIISMREDSEGDQCMEKYSVMAALYPEDSQINEEDENANQREQPRGFKFRNVLKTYEEEEDFENSEAGEYAMSYTVSGGEITGHRRPKNESIRLLQALIREELSQIVSESETFAEDIVDDSDNEALYDADQDEDVDEISGVAAMGGISAMPLGRGPTYPASDKRGRKRKRSKSVSAPYGK